MLTIFILWNFRAARKVIVKRYKNGTAGKRVKRLVEEKLWCEVYVPYIEFYNGINGFFH